MNEMKPVFVCVLIILMSNVHLVAKDQAPEAAASPKQATPTAPIAAEKSALAQSSKQAAKPGPETADFCRCVGEGDNSVSKKIEKTLASPLHQTGLDYADQPLEDVVVQLGDEYGIPIQINKAALDEAGIKSDTRINVTIHNISLRSALRLMLKSSQLTYVIENEVLSITTKEDAEKDVKICVYDVRRLTGDNGDLTQLIDIICSCVCEETWAKNGKGLAEIRPFKPGLLVIAQTRAVHEEIRNLLTTLDEMRNGRPGEASGGPIKAATGGSAERHAPASPSGTAVPKKAGASGVPVRNAADINNPFSG